MAVDISASESKGKHSGFIIKYSTDSTIGHCRHLSRMVCIQLIAIPEELCKAQEQTKKRGRFFSRNVVLIKHQLGFFVAL